MAMMLETEAVGTKVSDQMTNLHQTMVTMLTMMGTVVMALTALMTAHQIGVVQAGPISGLVVFATLPRGNPHPSKWPSDAAIIDRPNAGSSKLVKISRAKASATI